MENLPLSTGDDLPVLTRQVKEKRRKEMPVNVYEAIHQLNAGECDGAINILNIDKAMYRVMNWLVAGNDLLQDKPNSDKKMLLLDEYNKAIVLAELLDTAIVNIQRLEKRNGCI